MKEKEEEKPVVDEQYNESGDAVGTEKKKVEYSWGFFALVGCVILGLYEVIRAIIYFF